MKTEFREIRALDYFREKHNCAQAVMSAFEDIMEEHLETALKGAAGFGAGMARQGKTCGAISGAMAVIGIIESQEEPNEDKRNKIYLKVNRLHEEFKEIYGSCECSDLIKCDLNTEEGQEHFEKNNIFENLCVDCVLKTVHIVEEILSLK